MLKLFPPLLLAATALVHLWSCLRGKHELRKPTKVMLMPLLALCYLSLAENPSYLVIWGILLGGLGDLALLWPLKEKSFLLGVLAFFSGHVCYLAHVFSSYAITAGAVWTAAVAAVYSAGCLIVFIKTVPGMPRAVRVPSFLYMLILASVSACTLLVLISAPGTGRAVAFIGASLFLASDGILSQMLFADKNEKPVANFFVMLTYILAQAFMALGWAMG